MLINNQRARPGNVSNKAGFRFFTQQARGRTGQMCMKVLHAGQYYRIRAQACAIILENASFFVKSP